MSLTGVSPLIADWMRLKLRWMYHWTPTMRPFAIPAGGEVRVPSQEYIFEAPEGVLLTFGALFNDPSCGIRLECNPELDTDTTFTVANMVLAGLVNTPMYVTAMVPPRTLPGTYGVAQQKEWPWTEWMRLSIFNPDSVPHTCIGYAYTVATLREPRPRESVLDLATLKRLQLAYEMYPESRDVMKEKLVVWTEEFLEEQRIKGTKLEEKVIEK